MPATRWLARVSRWSNRGGCWLLELPGVGYRRYVRAKTRQWFRAGQWVTFEYASTETGSARAVNVRRWRSGAK